MAAVIITLKIMPEGPDVDLNGAFDQTCEKIKAFVGEKFQNQEIRKEEEPIGFGLKAIKVTFSMDESTGATDKLEDDIKEIEGVQSVETVGVTRALG